MRLVRVQMHRRCGSRRAWIPQTALGSCRGAFVGRNESTDHNAKANRARVRRHWGGVQGDDVVEGLLGAPSRRRAQRRLHPAPGHAKLDRSEGLVLRERTLPMETQGKHAHPDGRDVRMDSPARRSGSGSFLGGCLRRCLTGRSRPCPFQPPTGDS